MLEGFLGKRRRMAWLKSEGGVVGLCDNMSWRMSKKMGCAIVFRICMHRTGCRLVLGMS